MENMYVNILDKLKRKFSDAEILVDSSVMISKAGEVSTCIAKMNGVLGEMDNVINSTAAYWIGMAGEKYRAEYKKRKESIDEMIKRLGEHPEELKLMAGNYENVEKSVLAQNAQLKNDYI